MVIRGGILGRVIEVEDLFERRYVLVNTERSKKKGSWRPTYLPVA